MTMRFGVFIPQGWRMDLVGIEPAEQWATMSGLAQRADAGPWESIWVYDHFHTMPAPIDEATHEAWTLMAAFAATTSRVRLGQMCTCMAYRNPAYLAKVAATIDIISGGRVEMGIGAGWYEHEWRAYGYGFPPARERLRALDEGVQIMQQAWTTGSATLQGKVYQVDGAIVRPLPLQPGGIPFWIAGGGEKVTLRIAAQYAQYTNFDGTPEGFRHKSRGAGRSLPTARPRLRRDHPVGQLQHRDRPGREGGQRSARLAPRAVNRDRRRRQGRRRNCADLRGTARGRHAGADRGETDGPESTGNDVRDHLFPGAGLRHIRFRVVREGGHSGSAMTGLSFPHIQPFPWHTTADRPRRITAD